MSTPAPKKVEYGVREMKAGNKENTTLFSTKKQAVAYAKALSKEEKGRELHMLVVHHR
jgi:hypothetical protein